MIFYSKFFFIKTIETYTKETQGWSKCEILDVWKVSRNDEVYKIVFILFLDLKILYHFFTILGKAF